MPRIILFDLDGTLIDSRKDLSRAVNLMRKNFGLPPLNVEVVSSYVGNGMKKLVERSLKDTGISVEDALPVMKKAYSENLLVETTLYDGVYDGISQLKTDGWRMSVTSNKPTAFCREILDKLHLTEYLDFVIGGESGFPLKPDPAALEYILHETGVTNPAGSWILGDNHTDLEAGRRAKMKTAFAAYGFGIQNGIPYDLKVDSFPEFIERISR